jgi:hypothetical protein
MTTSSALTPLEVLLRSLPEEGKKPLTKEELTTDRKMISLASHLLTRPVVPWVTEEDRVSHVKEFIKRVKGGELVIDAFKKVAAYLCPHKSQLLKSDKTLVRDQRHTATTRSDIRKMIKGFLSDEKKE